MASDGKRVPKAIDSGAKPIAPAQIDILQDLDETPVVGDSLIAFVNEHAACAIVLGSTHGEVGFPSGFVLKHSDRLAEPVAGDRGFSSWDHHACLFIPRASSSLILMEKLNLSAVLAWRTDRHYLADPVGGKAELIARQPVTGESFLLLRPHDGIDSDRENGVRELRFK